MTRMLIRRHREAIEQVAQELLRETTLSGPELDELVEQYRTRRGKQRRMARTFNTNPPIG